MANSLDKNGQTDVIYIQIYQKPLDKVDHGLLLHKLSNLGIYFLNFFLHPI